MNIEMHKDCMKVNVVCSDNLIEWRDFMDILNTARDGKRETPQMLVVDDKGLKFLSKNSKVNLLLRRGSVIRGVVLLYGSGKCEIDGVVYQVIHVANGTLADGVNLLIIEN